jgi:hypothetical protein
MVSHVKIVSILMIVNGALATLLGAFYAVMGPFVVTMMQAERRHTDPDEKMVMQIIGYVYPAIGIPTVIAGILTLVAGIRTLWFRGRILALVALFLNVFPMCTLYCAPTSLGLLVYGLIVFFNADVARAFRMAADGMPAGRIEARFLKQRLTDRWDEDWEDDWEDDRYDRHYDRG